MAVESDQDTRTYITLVNHEEQYSLWLAEKAVPPGWTVVGEPGSKADCLAFVNEKWVDMTPLSLRRPTEEE